MEFLLLMLLITVFLSCFASPAGHNLSFLSFPPLRHITFQTQNKNCMYLSDKIFHFRYCRCGTHYQDATQVQRYGRSGHTDR